jgi:hypothetical protein
MQVVCSLEVTYLAECAQSSAEIVGGRNMTNASTSGCEIEVSAAPKASAGRVDLRFKPLDFAEQPIPSSVGLRPVDKESFDSGRRSLSLRHLTTARPFAGDCDVGIFFPTQSLHWSMSPRVRSHLPISSGGRPDNLAHARLE